MTTKNSMHYSGVTPEDDVNSELSNAPEIGPTITRSLRSQSATNPEFKNVTVCMGILFIVFITFLFVVGFSYRATKSNDSIATRNDGFDKTNLFSFLANDADSESAVVGSSSYPAILLYKYGKSDQIFGHIPHGWVDTEEPFLMVDQITMGVGESYLTKISILGRHYSNRKSMLYSTAQ